MDPAVEGESGLWSGDELDLDAYLARIGYDVDRDGELSPDLRTLTALHRAHVRSIPFENLDVALGRQVPLDVKSLQAKLVRRRRGGYCYEQNSLFAAALERIGFGVAGRGARNRTRGAALLPVTHALLAVETEGQQWLADVGFGWQGPLEPVPLRDGARVEQGGWTFGIGREADGIHVLRSLRPQGWTDLYAFSPQTLYPGDFTVMNHFSSSHPESRFLGQVVAQKPGPEVRRALVRETLSTVWANGAGEERIVTVGELAATLKADFGIEIDEEERAGLERLHPVGV
ncbi:arylamine N-acetyltransferase [Streptomyces sp. NBC_00094]|uniref:arylamine N-acetyltransferase family protein n=1 Tax=Streptomyces sp. NBC_00094 TaxID=2903620 RepID=UPI0022557539|nr:arylamine N-acetyltransferase [Streptomyces sp. NBC_00094]MCX5393651.1 arylamine N-acetyltransferase [Streptomyces sp. NBC_00094]